ncbi:MAG: YraN family protein [Hydrogenophilaceae bacterium]
MERGKAAEEEAAAYLSKQGLHLVERNWRCKGGEIDLIMRDGADLVFVEVRARKNDRFGGAAASITATKQGRLVHAARLYLAGLASPPPCRFDAVLLEGDRLAWLKNAFGETG